MRKLLSHAFSDAALRQQEDILKKYFDLLVSGLTSRIDASAGDNKSVTVDLAKWYNFLTFDGKFGHVCTSLPVESVEIFHHPDLRETKSVSLKV